MKNWECIVVAMLALLVFSCAPMHEKAWEENKGSTKIFDQKINEMKETIIITLAENAFQIEPVVDPRTIRARKVVAEGKKVCEISLSCYLFTTNGKETKVHLAAEEQISEISYKVKTFWLIFIPIPYGREPKREIIQKGSITDPDFFASFFGKLEKKLPK